MKIPILTSEIPMSDGSMIHLLLSKDGEALQAALDSIEAQTIGFETKEAQALKGDAWLVTRPDENGQWAPRKDDCPTPAKCQLCNGRVYWWMNQTQLWLHCACTQFIAPLSVPHVQDMKEMTDDLWKYFAGIALKGIKEWLASS